MLTYLKKFQHQLELSVPPPGGMKEALQWLLLARVAVLFVVLFIMLSQNVWAQNSIGEAALRNGLFLIGCSFFITFLQTLVLESISVGWMWVVFQILFDSVVTGIWMVLGQSSLTVFPLFFLIQILIVSLTFYQRGAWLSSLAAVFLLGFVSWLKVGSGGTILYLWGVYALIFIALGWVGGFLGEELRRTLENLKLKTSQVEKLTQFQEKILAELPTGLLTVDQKMRLNFMNPAAEHILAKGFAECVGKPLSEVCQELLPFFTQIEAESILDEQVQDSGDTSLSATGTEFHRSLFLNAKSETGGQARLQQTVEMRQGSQQRTLRGDVAEIDVLAGMGKWFQGQGEVGRVLLFQDVTKIVQLEEKLKQNEKLAAVGQLAAGIAHEIRNPLASMSASIEMLKTVEDLTDPENQRLMEITLREIERLNGLVSEFLEFVKPEKFEMKAVDLKELLSDIIKIASRTKGIQDVAHIRTELHSCRAHIHQEKMSQVIWNLLWNAAQAIQGKGEIEIGCEAVNENRVRWWITDTGQGMSEEVLKHIYEPFFTTKARGTGLGLPTAHKIVEAHQGQIRVKSKPGEGTRFEVLLPRGS